MQNLRHLLTSLVLVQPAHADAVHPAPVPRRRGRRRARRRRHLRARRPLGSAPARPVAEPAGMPAEQHLFDLATVQSEGVEVLVPPLHSEVVTAKLNVSKTCAARSASSKTSLRDARRALSRSTPAGLGVTVAWGMPYFDEHVAGAGEAHLPYDRRAGKPALLPTRRFPSDPHDTRPRDERRRRPPAQRPRASTSTPHARRSSSLPFFTVTSIRRGFAGGGFRGGKSLPKKMAVAAGVPGADLIPDGSELFLGFTSTQKAGLGPRDDREPRDARLRRSPLRLLPRRHAHAPLAHRRGPRGVVPQLRLRRARADRVPPRDDGACSRGRRRPAGAEAGLEPAGCSSASSSTTGRFGHSASIQATSRLLQDTVGDDGTVYPKGTAIPQRADFNTLDNPFAFSVDPKRDGMSKQPAAGVHFVVFNPSSDDFERNRLAMDGVLPGRQEALGAAAQPRAGLQLGAHDDAPPELPRPAPASPLVPARRAVTEAAALDPRSAGAAPRARGGADVAGSARRRRRCGRDGSRRPARRS